MNAKKYAGFALPSIFIVVTATYGYWLSQSELVSSRPATVSTYDVPDPVPAPGVRNVHSRIWEDPLTRSYLHWIGLNEAERETSLKTILNSKISHPAGSNETDKREKKWIDAIRRDMKQLFADLVEQPTICLPVFLPGGPNADTKEKRMRDRYAVVTALAESGYALQYNESMSYLVTKIYVRTLNGWQEREIVVPVKLYRDQVYGGDQVLVLWINESEVGEWPLLAIHRILNEIFSEVKEEHQENLKISIIGPSSSGTLSAIAREVGDISDDPETSSGGIGWDWSTPKDWSLSKSMELLAAKSKDLLASINPLYRSTQQVKVNRDHWQFASYQPLKPMKGFCPLLDPARICKKANPCPPVLVFSPRATKDDVQFPENRFFKLYRVIGTDGQLAEALGKELHRRECLPGNVVLITEHDTAYGRAIPKTFENAFAKHQGTIYTVKVLKGIDGKLIGDAKESPRSSSNKGGSADQSQVVERPPEGRSQYDYLKRLSGQIRALPDPPEAIGVVGSDVYDKLLVLRALKPQFPDCVFFTTDLDAIYVHSNEIQHTRNLIVASHFGLRLNKKLQQQTAPFRDSYQAATFLAARLAVLNRLDCATDASTQANAEPSELAKKIQAAAEIISNGKPDKKSATEDWKAWHESVQDYWREIVNNHEQLEKESELKRQIENINVALEFDRAWRWQLAEDLDRALETALENQADNEDLKDLSEKIPIAAGKIRTANSVKEVYSALFEIPFEINDLRNAEVKAVVAKIKAAKADKPDENGDYFVLSSEAWDACNKVWTTLSDEASEKGTIDPLIHVIGRNRAHQLTIPRVADGGIEAVVHPVQSPGVLGWHVGFIVVVSLGAICGVLLLTLRDRFRFSLLFDRDWDESSEGREKRLQIWRTRLDIGLLSLLGVGLLLLIAGLLFRAWIYVGVAAPLDGYTTWTRNMLYACTGIAGVILVAYILDRFIFALNQAKNLRDTKVCEKAWEVFRMTHVLKAAILAVVFFHVGALFVFGFTKKFMFTTEMFTEYAFISFVVGTGALVAAALYFRRPRVDNEAEEGWEEISQSPDNDVVSKNLILSASPVPAIWWGIAFMSFVTFVAFLVSLDGQFAGWNPASTSRNEITRKLDGLSQTYAFGVVGLVLALLLFFYLWCIEFSNYAKYHLTEQFPHDQAGELRMDMDSEFDRLWLIGKLTSVMGPVTPAVMGLLLVLVIAYHPFISPTPMPMGLLVIISIAVCAFFGPGLLVRWHFNNQREMMQSELQDFQYQFVHEELRAPAPGHPDDGGDGSKQVLVLSTGELPAHESEDRQEHHSRQPQLVDSSPSALAQTVGSPMEKTEHCKQQLEALSEGVFKPWAQSRLGWVFGGGASLALIDLWIRWFTYGL